MTEGVPPPVSEMMVFIERWWRRRGLVACSLTRDPSESVLQSAVTEVGNLQRKEALCPNPSVFLT